MCLSAKLSWWRHQMETFSALLANCAENSPVNGEFPTQRPVTRNFDVFFDLRLDIRSSKQSWDWWFETLSRPLWRHCNESFLFQIDKGVIKDLSLGKYIPEDKTVLKRWCSLPKNISMFNETTNETTWEMEGEYERCKLRCHYPATLQWRHNERDGISHHRRKSKEMSKLHGTGLCKGIHRWPVNSPHKGPVIWKMFPFDDVFMQFAPRSVMMIWDSSSLTSWF